MFNMAAAAAVSLAVLAPSPALLGLKSKSGSKRTGSYPRRALRVQAMADAGKPKVVGIGGAGIDYVATVKKYPLPDDKIRSEDLKILGGGNVGNALTAAARLGLAPYIITKLADDAMGDDMLSDFEREGVNTSCAVVSKGGRSPFTYIIVDQDTKTRTCIHQPGTPPLKLSEMSEGLMDRALEDAKLVYFDGRLPECALKLAIEANARGLPIVVEAERPREGLNDLLGFADYVITSKTFPEAWTNASALGDALLAMAGKLPHAKFIVSTLGDQGAVMLERAGDGASSLKESPAASTVSKLMEAGKHERVPAVAGRGTTASYIGLNQGVLVMATPPACFTRPNDLLSMLEGSDDVKVDGRFLYAPAVPLTQKDVVDTTGAGDAFIGAVLYGLATGLSNKKIMSLATTVAARNCMALGARPGLPYKKDLSPNMFRA
eukprot:jgi/Chlat1/5696/Chrsp38S05542